MLVQINQILLNNSLRFIVVSLQVQFGPPFNESPELPLEGHRLVAVLIERPDFSLKFFEIAHNFVITDDIITNDDLFLKILQQLCTLSDVIRWWQTIRYW